MPEKMKQDRFDLSSAYVAQIRETNPPASSNDDGRRSSCLILLHGQRDRSSSRHIGGKDVRVVVESLRDLGMREEALGIQTMCVGGIHRGLVQQHGHSLSTSQLAQEDPSTTFPFACVLSATERKQCKQPASFGRTFICAWRGWSRTSSRSVAAQLLLLSVTTRSRRVKLSTERLSRKRWCYGRRSLIAAQPATFAPDLADSLFRLSICLSELGHQRRSTCKQSRRRSNFVDV